MKKKNTLPNLQRVAVYIRVSTDAQAKKGDSMDEQRETCLDYIHAHDNMVLQDVYVDDGISGQKLRRGDFLRLMDDVRAGCVDLIIFTKLDRWFRSLRHYLNTQATLEEHNVHWLAVSQPYYDTTTPQGRAFIAQSMTFAELEAQNDSERILSVFEYKYRHGEVLSGSAPFGFSIVNKHLVPNDDAEKVRTIFEHYSRTNSLYSTLQLMQNEYGLIRVHSTLKALLRNTKYIGVYRDNENYCPPIVSRELFDDVQRKLLVNVKTGQKYDYIFSGLIICGECGRRWQSHMHTTKRKNSTTVYRYPSYRCYQHVNLQRCSNKKSLHESVIEKYLLENIKPLLSEYITEYKLKSAPIIDNANKRTKLESKIAKLKELFLNDLIDLNEYRTDRAAYLDQLAALSDVSVPPEKDFSALQQFLKLDIDSIYKSLDPSEKRALWRSVIREIHVDSSGHITIIFL